MGQTHSTCAQISRERHTIAWANGARRRSGDEIYPRCEHAAGPKTGTRGLLFKEMCCTRFLLPIHCKTAYRLPIRRACKEVPLLAVDGYSPVGAVRPPLIASAEHTAVGPCRRGRIPSCFTSAQCEIRRPWGTLKHHAPLRPRHGQSTASSARNPFPHTRAENDLRQPPRHIRD